MTNHAYPATPTSSLIKAFIFARKKQQSMQRRKYKSQETISLEGNPQWMKQPACLVHIPVFQAQSTIPATAVLHTICSPNLGTNFPNPNHDWFITNLQNTSPQPQLRINSNTRSLSKLCSYTQSCILHWTCSYTLRRKGWLRHSQVILQKNTKQTGAGIRIIEKFRLEGILWTLSSPVHCSKQGQLQSWI